MKQPTTINPYSLVGAQLQSSLTTIVAVLPPKATIEQLVDAIFNVVHPHHFPKATPQHTIELKSISYNAINSFRNNMVLEGNTGFNSRQMHFIQMLIGHEMSVTRPDTFPERLSEIEECIGSAQLTIAEQAPLFLATAIGHSAYLHWVAQLALNSGSGWVSRFGPNVGLNYLNTSEWATAAMNGALTGYCAMPAGFNEAGVNTVSINMVSVLIGALTTTVGKVIFNWVPKITKSMPPILEM